MRESSNEKLRKNEHKCRCVKGKKQHYQNIYFIIYYAHFVCVCIAYHIQQANNHLYRFIPFELSCFEYEHTII